MTVACQFCKVPLHACCEEHRVYQGKTYHAVCFEKVRSVARRTGGLL